MRKSLIAIAAAGVLMPAVAIAETTGALVGKWNELNELCRGGPRDDSKADEACERRDVVEASLEKRGCRFVIYTKGPHHEEWICRHKRKMK
jgi:sugar/nucleoside kinase (ribokinase family)